MSCTIQVGHLVNVNADGRSRRSFFNLLMLTWAGVGVVLLLMFPMTVSADGIGDLIDQVSVAQYRHYLDDELYTHDGDSRRYRVGTEHDLARDNILDHFKARGLETYVGLTKDLRGAYDNVVGIQWGVTNPEQIYILGGHYDSWHCPGADDDASGVAAMMEVARVLSKYEFDATIMYIAWDGEEDWMKGSGAWVDLHKDEDIRGMIAMDMIAYNPAAANLANISGRPGSDSLVKTLTDSLHRYTDLVSAGDGGEMSDHVPFGDAGFSACLFIEHNYRANPHYHQPTDSVDTPGYIDYEYATKIAKATLGCVAELAGLVGAAGYALHEPYPGIVNEVNTFTVGGATPGTKSFLVYGFELGVTNVPNCAGLVVEIDQPRIFFRGRADDEGEIAFERFVPGGLQGRTMYLQGVEVLTCETTELVEFVFE